MSAALIKLVTAICSFSLLVICYSIIFGQPQIDSIKIDSLKTVYQNHRNDSVGLNAMAKCAFISFDGDDSYNAIQWANQAILLATKLSDNRTIADMNRIIGKSYGKQSKFGDAVSYSYKAFKYYEIINDDYWEAKMLQEIGVDNYYLGKMSEARSAYEKAYQIRKQMGDKPMMAQTMNTIGLTLLGNSKGHSNDSARSFFEQSLIIFKEFKDSVKWGVPYTYKCIGNSYIWDGDKYDLQGNEKLSKKNYAQALYYYNLADSLTLGGDGEAKLSMADMMVYLGRYRESRSLFNEIIEGELKKDNPDYRYLMHCYQGFSNLEHTAGNYRAAYDYYVNFISYRDSITNEESRTKAIQAEIQYNFDKKEAAAKAEQDKKDALANAELQKQKTISKFIFGGAFILIGFGGYAFYNYRRRRKFEKQQALSNERLRISRELHDDIGSTLGSIAVYSDVARNRSRKNENPQEALSKIGLASRELIEKMGDIIWNLNPEHESFEQLQHRMQAFASMILTPKDIAVNFQSDEVLKTVQLTVEQRKNLFLIYKEAIHNIVKHADGKNVLISLTKSNNAIHLLVKDDGKGFEINRTQSLKPKVIGGNGMSSMAERAEKMKAALNIVSKQNEGTAIELSINI